MNYPKWMLPLLLVAALLAGGCQPLTSAMMAVPDTPRPDAPPYGQRGPYHVGTMDIVVDPASARPLPVTVWYPALQAEGMLEEITYHESYPPVFDDYAVAGRALEGAGFDLSGGPYPLIIFSTGLNSSRLIAVHFTEHLASHGFVVMAPDHPGTTPSAATGDSEYWSMYVERPQDILRVIDYASAEGEQFEGLLDPEHIGVTGASSGSVATFAAGGAQIELSRCQDPAESVECSQIAGHEAELASLAGLDQVPGGAWPPLFDEPVDAIVPIVPDYGFYGPGDVGLAPVSIPTMIIGAGGDTVNPVDLGARPFYATIASNEKALVVLEDAWHVFLVNACSANPWMMSDQGWGHWFCSDPVWDMQRAHDISNHFVTAFFLAELKGDDDAAAMLAPDNVELSGIDYQAKGF